MSFTFRHLRPDDPYFPNWLDLRRRQRWFWIAVPAFISSTLLFGVFSTVVLKREGFPWFAIPGLLIVVGTRLYQLNWHCPRCGRPFYLSGRRYWPFATSCLHCGLAEFAANETE